MSTVPTPADRPATGPAVIRQVRGAEETPHERLMRKHLPAWVTSGAVHVLLVVVLLVASVVFAKPAGGPASDSQLMVAVDDKNQDEKQPDLTNTDIGIDPDIPAVAQNDNVQDVNVDTKITPTETPGIEESKETAKVDVLPPAGIGDPNPLNPGATGTEGASISGLGSGGDGLVANAGFVGRGAATKSKLLSAGGGNARSEAAVARGLAWLAKQQKANGAWIYDGSARGDTIASTGMGLLPFLAAGQTHKYSKDNKYNKNVEAGLKYLLANQNKDGSFRGSSGMYSHAIATVALCEALGMTGDRTLLQRPSQAAINYILAAQGADGSWGYTAGTTGDTSIVGWQIQALHSAKLCKELVLDKKAFERASKFLDSVAGGQGSQKATYGYRTPGGTPTLTSVGLLSRYYMDGWGPNHPGMTAGVQYLMKSQLPDKNRFDMYYYYYATQVIHFYEGPEWHKEWNPKMRDMLVDMQVPEGKGPNSGSWDPNGDPWFGQHCGRLGVTCMVLLTLEVYYRHLPLYKRGTGGLQEVDRVK